MPKKKDLSHVSTDWIVEEYINKNKSLKEMSDILNISEPTFVRLLRERNIKKGQESQNLIGNKYNRWTVIELSEKAKNHDCIWICQCECGTIKPVYGGSLKAGTSKSCGCWNKESSRIRCQNKVIGMVNGNLINQICWGADRRRIERPPNREDLRILIEQQFEKQEGKCALTGEKIFFDIKDEIGNIIYGSGNVSVDRIDSTKGYIEGNIQLVLKWINISKNTMTQNEFINNCRKIVNYADKQQ